MSRRNIDYLIAHNRRRQGWHRAYNVLYKPVACLPGLAETTRWYAVDLLENYSSDGIVHEPRISKGENLVKNKRLVGEENGGWGRLYPSKQ